MNRPELARAIRKHAEALADAASDHAHGIPTHERDTLEFVRCLARWVEGVPLARAMGAPGDWGYNHPVGQAIASPPGETADHGRDLLEAALAAYNAKDLEKTLAHVTAFTKHIAEAVEQVEPLPPAASFSNCTHVLRAAGKAYPRTCAECGLGPCKNQAPATPPTPCAHNWKPTGKGKEMQCWKCGVKTPF